VHSDVDRGLLNNEEPFVIIPVNVTYQKAMQLEIVKIERILTDFDSLLVQRCVHDMR